MANISAKFKQMCEKQKNPNTFVFRLHNNGDGGLFTDTEFEKCENKTAIIALDHATSDKIVKKYNKIAYKNLESYIEYLHDIGQPNLYEILKENRKLYFDYECEVENAAADFITDFKNFHITLFYEIFIPVVKFQLFELTIVPESGYVDPIILHSHNIGKDKCKISFHVIYPNIYGNKTNVQTVAKHCASLFYNAVKNNRTEEEIKKYELKLAIKDIVIKNYIRENDEIVDSINRKINFNYFKGMPDMCVYDSNRPFRFPNCSKLGKNIFLQSNEKFQFLDACISHIDYDDINMWQIDNITYEPAPIEYKNNISDINTFHNKFNTYENIAQIFENLENVFDYHEWRKLMHIINNSYKLGYINKNQAINIGGKFTAKRIDKPCALWLAESYVEAFIDNNGGDIIEKPITVKSIISTTGIFRQHLKPAFLETLKTIYKVPKTEIKQSDINSYEKFNFDDFKIKYTGRDTSGNHKIYETRAACFDAISADFSKVFAILPGTGDSPNSLIVKHNCDDLLFSQSANFKKKVADIKFKIRNGDGEPKDVGLYEIINEFNSRVKFYTGVKYDPANVYGDDGRFNMWQGIKAKIMPIEALQNENIRYIYKFLSNDIIKTVFANGDKKIHKYLLALFRTWFCNIGEKGNICLFVSGLQGVGKTYLGNFFKNQIFGNRVAAVLTGGNIFNFNSLLAGKCFTLLDELPDNTHKDKEIFDILKGWITGDELTINEKHVKQYQVMNIINFMIASNNILGAMFLEETNRRVLALNCNPVYRANYDFWNDATTLLNKTHNFNGIEYTAGDIFLSYLFYKTSLLSINLKDKPITEYEKTIIEYSKSTVKAFILYFVDNLAFNYTDLDFKNPGKYILDEEATKKINDMIEIMRDTPAIKYKISRATELYKEYKNYCENITGQIPVKLSRFKEEIKIELSTVVGSDEIDPIISLDKIDSLASKKTKSGQLNKGDIINKYKTVLEIREMTGRRSHEYTTIKDLLAHYLNYCNTFIKPEIEKHNNKNGNIYKYEDLIITDKNEFKKYIEQIGGLYRAAANAGKTEERFANIKIKET